MRQQLYLDQRYGYEFPDGSYLFWLQEPIQLPSSDYQFTLSVPHATIPLTHWVITEENRTLELVYATSSDTIELPTGNYSIDEVVDFVNAQLTSSFAMSYNQNRNTVSFTSDTEELEVGHNTTCAKLLGIRAGEASEFGVYEGTRGVNLQGTSSFYIRSNLRTRNRDPLRRGYGNLLASVPITRAHNGIEVFTSRGYSFSIMDRSVHYIILQVLDDEQLRVSFHGGDWSVTLEFDVVDFKVYSEQRSFRDLISNGPIGGATNPEADKRKDKDNGRP